MGSLNRKRERRLLEDGVRRKIGEWKAGSFPGKDFAGEECSLTQNWWIKITFMVTSWFNSPIVWTIAQQIVRGFPSKFDRECTKCTCAVEEAVLQEIERKPRTTLRIIESYVGVPHFIVMRILYENTLHTYHINKLNYSHCVMAINRKYCIHAFIFLWMCCTAGISLVNFVYWWSGFYIEWCPEPAKRARAGTWKPKILTCSSSEQRSTIHIWSGIIGNFWFIFIYYPNASTGISIAFFLEKVLPDLMVSVPPYTRWQIWFQHDGVPAHFSRNVRNTSIGPFLYDRLADADQSHSHRDTSI